MMLEEAIQLRFEYAAGGIGSRCLAALRDEATLLAGRCSAGDHVACPASSMCPRCGALVEALEPAGPGGRLLAWTRDDDTVFGLIRVDGADNAMIHRLLGAQFEPGQRVQARFAEDRIGSILDISGFEVAP